MKYWPSHRSDTFVLVDDPRYRVVEKDGRRAITCKRCGRTSHNPTDVRNVYCGNCHRFLLDPPPAEVATPAAGGDETRLAGATGESSRPPTLRAGAILPPPPPHP
jgi:RNase P subunit RPR2